MMVDALGKKDLFICPGKDFQPEAREVRPISRKEGGITREKERDLGA